MTQRTRFGSELTSFSPLSAVYFFHVLLGHFPLFPILFFFLNTFLRLLLSPRFFPCFTNHLSSDFFLYIQQYHQNRFSCYSRYEGNSNLYEISSKTKKHRKKCVNKFFYHRKYVYIFKWVGEKVIWWLSKLVSLFFVCTGLWQYFDWFCREICFNIKLVRSIFETRKRET